MATRTNTHSFQGPEGAIDCALDWPDAAPKGWALLLHPHPLFGGARDNKVVTTLSRACVQAGLLAVRPDFRGVGASGGQYDEGRGETDDMLQLIPQVLARYPEVADGPFVLGGFSFGTAVASQVHARRQANQEPDPAAMLMIGTAAERFGVAAVPAHTLVVHGELDDTVSLQSVFDWARPQELPVVVMPGAEHFFHGKLVGLKALVADHLALRLG
ncbi:MAG: alpha/beta hydrolase [Pigmentiphaga sp.]|nr:alpha/beta hydrolase [Pigmentiphaga sp.]